MQWFRGSPVKALRNRPHWAHVALAVILLLGLVMTLATAPTSAWNALGQSLLVAGILGFTVELFVGEAILEHVVDEAFRQATLHNLPDEVHDVQRYLRGLKLLRKDASLVWRFRDMPGDQERLRVTSEIRYSVANYSDEQQAYRFRYGTSGADVTGQTLIRVHARGGDLERTIHQDGPGLAHVDGVSEHVEVAPNQGDCDNEFCVVTEREFNTDDSFISFLNTPTLGLSVETDTGGMDLALDVTLGNQRIDDVHEEPEDDPRFWKLRDSLFFPWQAVVLDWKRNENAEDGGRAQVT